MSALETLRTKRVGVLMGGLSNERDVSLKTGEAVLGALGRLGVEAVAIDAGRDVAAKIEQAGVDLAFIALHGRYGEDGCVQGALELADIPYTGAGVAGSAIAMNKALAKLILKAEDIDTPPATFLDKASFGGTLEEIGMAAPVVVKPASGGSSIGVTICGSDDAVVPAVERAFEQDDEALVEEYIEGTLITVGIVGDTILPTVEIETKNGFYDYESKYTPGRTAYHMPARLDKSVLDEAARITMKAHRAMRVRGVSRSELIADRSGRVWFLELNTIPGMTETSLLPKAAAHIGMSFDDLTLTILAEALPDETPR